VNRKSWSTGDDDARRASSAARVSSQAGRAAEAALSPGIAFGDFFAVSELHAMISETEATAIKTRNHVRGDRVRFLGWSQYLV